MSGVRHFESLGEIEHRVTTGGPKARPIEYRGYQMRSHLECRFAWHLDTIGESWDYEPRTFGRSYLPDFQLTSAPRPTFVEVKPTLAEVPAAKVKAAVIWKTYPDALILIAVAEGCTWFASTGGDWESWTERWKA